MDIREQGGLPSWVKFEETNMLLAFDIEGVSDEPYEVYLSAKFEVCSTCGGKGDHVNPSVDSHGLTSDDFDQDPSFREDYLSGVFDVTCNTCKGRRVVPVPDEETCDPEVLQLFEDKLRDEAEYQRMCADERRMGA